MRKGRSFWYAQAQVSLICAGAGHFHAHAQPICFIMRRAFVWYPVTQVSFETHLNFFFLELISIFETTYSNLFLSKTCFLTIALDNFRMCFISVK